MCHLWILILPIVILISSKIQPLELSISKNGDELLATTDAKCLKNMAIFKSKMAQELLEKSSVPYSAYDL